MRKVKDKTAISTEYSIGNRFRLVVYDINNQTDILMRGELSCSACNRFSDCTFKNAPCKFGNKFVRVFRGTKIFVRPDGPVMHVLCDKETLPYFERFWNRRKQIYTTAHGGISK